MNLQLLVLTQQETGKREKKTLFFLFPVALLLALTASISLQLPIGISAASAQDAAPQAAEADQLYQQGVQLLNSDQLPQALEIFNQVLEMRGNLGDRQGIALTLNQIGTVYLRRGEYPVALQAYQRALIQIRQTDNRSGEARVLNNMGLAQSYLGQYSEALQSYQQALTINQQNNDTAGLEITLSNMGGVYLNQSQYPQALETYQRVLSLNQQSGDRSRLASTLNSIGEVYRKLAQYSQALDYYQQALGLYRELGESRTLGSVLNNMGLVYYNLGQYSQAEDFYRQALESARAVGNYADQASTLNNLGEIYRKLRQYQQALEFYQEALALARTVQDPLAEQTALNNIGEVYREFDDPSQALTFYQQALERARSLNDRASEGLILSNIGSVYQGQNQPDQALQSYQQALLIHQEVGDRTAERVTLSNLGSLFAEHNQIELAIAFYKQAVNVTESIRGDLQALSQEQQQSYAETVADTYRSLADLLLRQDRVLEAQQILDLLKVQELDDYLHDVRGNDQTAHGIEYWQPEQQILNLYSQAIPQGEELTRLRATPTSGRTPAQQQRLAELVANQQNMAQSFNDFVNRPEVVAAVEQLNSTTRRQNIDLEELNALQDNLKNLNQNAVLLYPLILEDRLELVLVTPNAPPIRRTVPVTRQQLNQAIATLRQSLTSRTSTDTTAAQQLYQWLVQPIENDLQQANAETILYAPDGPLRYVPLAVLYDGNQWLIQRFRVNYITAASLTDFDTPPHPQLRVLAGAFTQGSYNFQVGTRQFSLAGLPYARVEVQQIAEEISDTTQLVDAAFSRDSTVSQMNDYTIVHLATHAEFVPGQPEDSFILFGNGDRANLRDVASWSLGNVDLVVLSACRTAVGGELGNGQEILGFGYQLQRTGARAAIASLWSVDDGGTQVLMNAFYAALERGTTTKAEALRQAQIALITGNYSALGISEEALPEDASIFSRPYYWAPFILIGNGL